MWRCSVGEGLLDNKDFLKSSAGINVGFHKESVAVLELRISECNHSLSNTGEKIKIKP